MSLKNLKQTTRQLIATAIVCLFFTSMLTFSSCSDAQSASTLSSVGKTPPPIALDSITGTLAVGMFDFSKTMKIAGYKQLTVTMVRDMCNVVALTGGLVVIYPVGNMED